MRKQIVVWEPLDYSRMWKESRTCGLFSKWGIGPSRVELFAHHTSGPRNPCYNLKAAFTIASLT